MPDLPEPEATAITAVGAYLGIKTGDVRPLRQHDASTLLLPDHRLVVRLTAMSEESLTRATKAVHLTTWLAHQAFPAIRPAIADPVLAAGHVATVWHAVTPAPDLGQLAAHTALGRLLRELHAMPAPPIPLPVATPFHRLRAAIDLDTARPQPVLSEDDRAFLTARIHELDHRYQSLTFPLGVGLIHNDAHPGNILPDPHSPHGYIMIDWDSACTGPREMDLILTGAPASRFGDTEELRQAFTAGYGCDIATWPGHRILRDIRDLHSLAGHIRAAPHHSAARRELRRRVRSLRENDFTIRWHAV